ncbi:MAG TPA: TonB-dependent receptor [Polyangiaceae bacterium]|nr:TonB-dependent receptor [Polyangiaceae bacterium]
MKHIVSLAALLAVVYPAASVQAQTADQPQATPPQLTHSIEPEYPATQVDLQTTVVVGLALTIDVTGKVSDVQVLESGGPDFDAAALKAARELEFSPALRNGEPSAAKIPFRFEFKPIAAAPAATATDAVQAPVAPTAAQPAATPVPASSSPPSATAPSAGASDETLDVDVQGQRPAEEPTRREISKAEITRIPGTNGDAIRSVQNMPGVARPPGLAGMLIVRGSAPQDSQIFANGVNIPEAFHFGGVSSVLPSEILDRLDFYPGNFGPQYGRAMGGIVSLETRSPRSDGLHGLLQLDLLDGRVLAETPLSDSTRILVGARRSWVDAWLGPVMKSGGLGVSVAPVYYDGQVLIEHDLTSKTRLRLFAFGSDDRLRLLNPTPDPYDPSDGGGLSLHTGFWRLVASSDTRPNSDIRWTNSISVGQDREQFAQGNIDVLTQAVQSGLRSDLRWQLGKRVAAGAGVDGEFTAYDVHWRFPQIDIDSGQTDGPLFGRPTADVKAKVNRTRPSLYTLLEIEPIDHLKLLPSVRANYDSDTTNVTLEPRFSARYDVHPEFPRTTLKGGAGVYYQPPQPYESIEPFGTKGVRSPHAIHYSLGIEQELARPVELSVEGFYKDLQQLVVSAPAQNTEAAGTAYANVGKGRVYGAELMLRYKPVDRFFGWIAYTLSRSERRDNASAPWTLFDYDQTHILTALGSYKLGRGWELGARFRYVTGSPYTPFLGGVMDFDAGAYAQVQSPNVNSSREASFQQLDVRVDKTWRFKSWQLSAYLDVQNAYNHKNTSSPSYNFNYSETASTPGLPILPIVGVRGEL